MAIDMKISLDTNVWVFGLAENNQFCQRILQNLSNFDVIVPNQVRAELIRNLSDSYVDRFYQLVNKF